MKKEIMLVIILVAILMPASVFSSPDDGVIHLNEVYFLNDENFNNTFDVAIDTIFVIPDSIKGGWVRYYFPHFEEKIMRNTTKWNYSNVKIFLEVFVLKKNK